MSPRAQAISPVPFCMTYPEKIDTELTSLGSFRLVDETILQISFVLGGRAVFDDPRLGNAAVGTRAT